MVVLIDTERGHLSVRHQMRSGAVRMVEAQNLQKVEQVAFAISQAPESERPQRVVIDTVSRLASTTRRDITISPDRAAQSIWNNRNAMVSDQRHWGTMSDMLARLVDRFLALGIPLVVTCHEQTKEVDGVEKHVPSLNPALLGEIYGLADIVGRVFRLPNPLKINDREYQPGTRMLLMDEDRFSVAKTRNPDPTTITIPQVMIEPTFGKIITLLGESPLLSIFYGSPGAGKTTLSCSDATIPPSGNVTEAQGAN